MPAPDFQVPEGTTVFPITDKASWLAMRTQDITAGDCAAIAGLHRYRTPLRVYAEKVGAAPQVDETPIMRRGRWLEPAIVMALSETYPTWSFRQAKVYLRDPALRIGATPDVVAIDPERPGIGNVQMKVVARRTFNEAWQQEDGTFAPPVYYQIQSLVEAKLEGASWAAVAAMVIGEFSADLHLFPVEIHDGAWERIKSEVAFFWDCVARGAPPPLDPARDAETVRAIWPKEKDDPTPLDLSGLNHLPDLLMERERLTAEVKDREGRLDEIGTELRGILKDAAAGTLPGWGLTCKTERRKGYTVEPKDTRVLRVRKIKGAAA